MSKLLHGSYSFLRNWWSPVGLLWNPKVHYHVHNSLALYPIQLAASRSDSYPSLCNPESATFRCFLFLLNFATSFGLTGHHLLSFPFHVSFSYAFVSNHVSCLCSLDMLLSFPLVLHVSAVSPIQLFRLNFRMYAVTWMARAFLGNDL
jgi:hypothetical protein